MSDILDYNTFIEMAKTKAVPAVYFVRHAESEGNTLGIFCTASQETPLTHHGEDVARRIGQWFCEHEKHVAIYSSPKERSVQTASAIAECFPANVNIEPRFSERDWGEFNMFTWNDLSITMDRFDDERRYEFIPNGGESWQAMETRLFRALVECVEVNESGTAIIVVTHGGCLRAILPRLAQSGIASHKKYSVPTGSVSKFLPAQNELEFFGKIVA